jgi:hypothetical protein
VLGEELYGIKLEQLKDEFKKSGSNVTASIIS